MKLFLWLLVMTLSRKEYGYTKHIEGNCSFIKNFTAISFHCNTVVVPLNCNVEFLVNGTSVAELRHYNGVCYTTLSEGVCHHNICSCSCNNFTLNYTLPFIEESFETECKARFPITYTELYQVEYSNTFYCKIGHQCKEKKKEEKVPKTNSKVGVTSWIQTNHMYVIIPGVTTFILILLIAWKVRGIQDTADRQNKAIVKSGVQNTIDEEKTAQVKSKKEETNNAINEAIVMPNPIGILRELERLVKPEIKRIITETEENYRILEENPLMTDTVGREKRKELIKSEMNRIITEILEEFYFSGVQETVDEKSEALVVHLSDVPKTVDEKSEALVVHSSDDKLSLMPGKNTEKAFFALERISAQRKSETKWSSMPAIHTTGAQCVVKSRSFGEITRSRFSLLPDINESHDNVKISSDFKTGVRKRNSTKIVHKGSGEYVEIHKEWEKKKNRTKKKESEIIIRETSC